MLWMHGCRKLLCLVILLLFVTVAVHWVRVGEDKAKGQSKGHDGTYGSNSKETSVVVENVTLYEALLPSYGNTR